VIQFNAAQLWLAAALRLGVGWGALAVKVSRPDTGPGRRLKMGSVVCMPSRRDNATRCGLHLPARGNLCGNEWVCMESLPINGNPNQTHQKWSNSI
jgi:hypothetical protein